MNILIADKFPESYVKELESLGHTITFQPGYKAEDLPAAIAGQSVLIVRSTKVPAVTIEKGDALKLIIRAGSGYDTIDVKTAGSRGVRVANCPGKNAIAVAELTMGLLLAIDRRIPDNVMELREGKWNKKVFGKADGLYGRVMGVIGLGRIGQEVVRRAKAFGLKVVGWSRSLTPERAEEMGISYCNDLLELSEKCDIVTIHLAKTAETQGVIGKEFLLRLKPNAILIHAARGGVLDEAALKEVLKNKPLRIGLDVYVNEPAASDKLFTDDIAQHPAVYGTHHIGASTEQAQEAIAAEAVHIITIFEKTGETLNCVNQEHLG